MIAGTRQRLVRTPAAKRSDNEQALLATIDFVLALGQADGARAAALVDAIGYQAVPLEGELPEKPEKPVLPATLEKQVGARARADFGRLPAGCFEVVAREAARSHFEAVAAWMLPDDRVVLCRPPSGEPTPGWTLREACLVVRIRGGKAPIIGGNLLEAIGAPQ